MTFRRASNSAKDLTSKVFGRLTALRDSGERQNAKIMWLCLCECGVEKLVRSSHLLDGSIRSCGCLASEETSRRQTTHGLSKSPVYAVFRAMHQRCEDPTHDHYRNYGGRGIRVCRRWSGADGFFNFIEDMGIPPRGLSLERKDPNKNYTPENCCWVPIAKQARNKQYHARVEWEGKTWLLIELAEHVGLPYKEVHRRIRRGWTVARAISQPLRTRRQPVKSLLAKDFK